MSEEISIGKCPFCDTGVIKEKEKLFVCSNSKSVKKEDGSWKTVGCKFRVFKNQFASLGHPLITTSEMITILADGSLLVSLISKKGLEYKGKIRIDKKSGGVKMMFRNKFKD